ncbi:MAG TPA: DUF6526 family protein [Vicinamibacterales bacterium]|jgi:hypothetical protein
MADRPQTFENHARFVPGFHGVAFGLLVINLLWSLYRVVRPSGIDTIMQLLLAVALLLLFVYVRQFPLTVQDRVIRLEMRLRLARLLPPEVTPAIDRFTVDQLVALRFASDEELPALARQVLDQSLTDRKVIKKLVKNWQADNLRA